jgi:hypothetical protein
MMISASPATDAVREVSESVVVPLTAMVVWSSIGVDVSLPRRMIHAHVLNWLVPPACVHDFAHVSEPESSLYPHTPVIQLLPDPVLLVSMEVKPVGSVGPAGGAPVLFPSVAQNTSMISLAVSV